MQNVDGTGTTASADHDAGTDPADEGETHADTEVATRTVEGGKQLSFDDAVEVRTTKDQLWAAISDPETLTACVPGAEDIDRVSTRRYTVDITRGVSHLTVSLSGEFEFVELSEPDWVVVSGFAHDTKTGSDFDVLAAMELESVDEETTELAYTADVSFTGGVASLGTGLLRPIVHRDVDAYFQNLRSAVGGPSDP